MAGYVRQSQASILNGTTITAPPLNAEFDQLLAAFNATTGHGHTGGTGDSPKIPLATSVSGYLPSVNGGTGGKNNFSNSSPTVTDDSGDGYSVGSLWINTTTKRIFICTSNTSNAALWYELVANTGTALAPQTHNTVDIGTNAIRYKDFFLAGNADIDGTLNVLGTTTATHINTGTITSTGLGTFATIDANGGQVDGAVIGGNSASAITGTQITANSGFVGDVTGDVAGNVTSSGTSGFNNITASGTIQGAVTGNVAGNVTATTGTSQFNNVTVNGTLNMDGTTAATIQNLSAPVNANDAARKIDVDTAVSNLVDSSPAALNTLNELAAALGDDSDFSNTITTSIGTKLPKAGGTMTGAIDMGSQKITTTYAPLNNSDLSNKLYIDTQDNLQVTKTGDSMSGQLAMGNNKIVNLATPTASTDASNKAYVDSLLGSATVAAASAAAAATSESNAAVSEANALASKNTAQDWAIKTNGTVDGTNYSAKYWATQADVGTVATNVTSMNTVAAAIANVNLTAGSIAAVNAVATNISNVTDFFDTYFVSANAPTGSNVTEGDLWFDTTSQILKVRSASGFQSAGSSINGTAERKDYLAGTASGSYNGSSLTTFPAVYDPTYADVYLNGIKLAPEDFTASDGANVVLGSAATSGDTISIVSFGTFQLADHYSKTITDTLLSDVEALALAGM